MQAKILLVDDDRDSRRALRAILEDLAHGVVEASSGEEALRQLAADEFAVVILDVQMPHVNGFETARLIRDRNSLRHTPIIFLTAHGKDEIPVEDAYALGAVDYLLKPVSPVVLRAKVAEFVQLFQAREDARRQSQEFRLLVQGTTEYAIFMLDPEGRVRTWNAGAERIKGYKAEEIIGQHFSRFYPQEALQRGWPAEELRRAAAEGRLEDEGWRIRKDGSRFWANVMITALRDEEGRLQGFSKVTRDLTERKKSEENERRLLQEQSARRAAEESTEAARRAEQAERSQREQLHVTLRSIGDAVIVTDMHGHVTFMNPVAQGLTGWELKDAIGQPLVKIFDIVNEETRLPVEDPVTTVLREGVIVGLANHTVLIAKDGKEVPIDDSGAPIRDKDGKIEGVVLVFRDVTEARRAIEVRLNLAAIVESSNDAIIGKNLEGVVTSWNQGAERLFGYTAEEIIGKPLSILVPPDQTDEFPAIMERLKRGERIEHFETVRRRKDGWRVYVSLTISPIRNAYGKLIGASKVARDISERKRTEESLRFLADASAALASIVDYKSTLRKVAKMAVPFFGDWCLIDMLQTDGALQRLEVVHADRSKIDLLLRMNEFHPIRPSDRYGPAHVIRTGVPEMVSQITDEMLSAAAQDESQLAFLRGLQLRSYIAVPLVARGKSLGVITFLTSESGREFTTEHLALAQELAHRAAVAIDNALLYGELKESDRMKDEFLAMLAHELRNPLAPVRNALQVLKMADGDAGVQAQAREMAERQVQHMARLLDDLLDVSRISRGMIELRSEAIEAATIVNRTIEATHSLIVDHQHRLTISLPTEPLWIHGDQTRLEQVLTNLLNNAAKYTDRGGHISLSVEREGQQVVLRVRDTGIGIAPSMLPKIFDLFVQAERRLDHARGGAGIGLTLVRRLVELHGGTIEARSQGPGQGSEFIVRLPALEQEPKSRRDSRAARGTPGSLPQLRVLVVDDSHDAADSLAMLLKLAGQHVRTAYSGGEALQAIAVEPPDVVFLDIGMPGMDGYEVARQVRRQAGLENVILAALTGWGQAEDRRRTEAAGFDYHLVKPPEPAAIHAVISGVKKR